jgi:class 3 adenylate cyclase
MVTFSTPANGLPEERHNATVMCTLIPGISELAESMDPVLGRELIKGSWLQLDALVEEFGGYPVKHLGDEMVAVWGIPQPGDDDADQAVKAALALQKSFQQTKKANPTAYESLQIRIGVHTGPLMAMHLGTHSEYTVIGGAVSVCSHLANRAKAGGVLISESTFKYVRGAFELQRQEIEAMPGKIEKLAAFVVEGVQATEGRSRYGGSDNFQTRMVGREDIFGELLAIYRQTSKADRPTLVVLTGEAGIGKSRLMMEFTAHLESENPALYLMSTRALEQAARVPFYVCKMLWYNRFGIRSEDMPAEAGEKFIREVQKVWGRQLGPVPVIEAAQLVGSLMGLEYPGSPYLAKYNQDTLGRVERAYEMTRELVRRICTSRATAIVIDDLQWADEDSLDLLLYLLRAPSELEEPLPMFVLASAHAEFIDQRPEVAQIAQVIELGPTTFTAKDVAAAYPRLAMLPEHVRTSIAGFANGNAYFLEEIARSLITGKDGSDEAGLLQTLTLLLAEPPESLEALLHRRIKDLPRLGRAAALVAAVVGRVFWVGALEAAVRAFVDQQGEAQATLPSALAEQSIKEGLRQLVQAELAFPKANSTYSSKQEYIFKHDLVRKVAYSMIPPTLRSQYHLAIGKWLVGQSELDNKIMAADQFEMAGAYSEAIEACQQAASLFQIRGAVGEAQMLLERTRLIRNRSVMKI